AVQGVISQLRTWAARPPASWPMVMAIDDGYLDRGERGRLVADVTAVITSELAPAYLRTATTLESQVLPVARDVEGLAGLAAGPDCYAAEIRHHPTLPMTAAQLHDLGQSEVARVEAAIIALGHDIYGVDTLTAIRDR